MTRMTKQTEEMDKLLEKREENTNEASEFLENEKEKREKNIRSKITFELVSPNYVMVLCAGKEVGSFWSELNNNQDDKYRFPYPHTNKQIDTLQVCGFDECSQVWGCGRYEGKEDLVLTFKDTVSNEFWNDQEREYRAYLERKLKSGNIQKIQSFHDFVKYNIGQFD